MSEHKTTIQKLVKNCAKSDSKWNCFSIKKIQGGIGKDYNDIISWQKFCFLMIYILSLIIKIYTENYDRGMKMLVKIAKNPNASLYSHIEDKGKRKRLKKPVQHFDDLNKENLEK